MSIAHSVNIVIEYKLKSPLRNKRENLVVAVFQAL